MKDRIIREQNLDLDEFRQLRNSRAQDAEFLDRIQALEEEIRNNQIVEAGLRENFNQLKKEKDIVTQQLFKTETIVKELESETRLSRLNISRLTEHKSKNVRVQQIQSPSVRNMSVIHRSHIIVDHNDSMGDDIVKQDKVIRSQEKEIEHLRNTIAKMRSSVDRDPIIANRSPLVSRRQLSVSRISHKYTSPKKERFNEENVAYYERTIKELRDKLESAYGQLRKLQELEELCREREIYINELEERYTLYN